MHDGVPGLIVIILRDFEFSAEFLTADIANLLSVIANFDFTIGQVIDGITVSCSTPIQVVVTDARQ